MGYLEFYGCLLLIWSFPIGVYAFFLRSHPFQFLFILYGTFFSFLPLFLTGIIWIFVIPLREIDSLLVFLLIFFVEIFRFITFYTFEANMVYWKQMIKEREDFPNDLFDYLSCLSVNFGYAFTLLCCFSLNSLTVLYGPGSYGIEEKKEFPNYSLYMSIHNSVFFFVNFLGGTSMCSLLKKVRANNEKKKIFLTLLSILILTHYTTSIITIVNPKKHFRDSAIASLALSILTFFIFLFVSEESSRHIRLELLACFKYFFR
ncbi:hypothetical protein SNEBB_008020 [Seison nebaliae]|nr:hypothetical protein SNEBB_008020 [Seison nebaliae]